MTTISNHFSPFSFVKILSSFSDCDCDCDGPISKIAISTAFAFAIAIMFKIAMPCRHNVTASIIKCDCDCGPLLENAISAATAILTATVTAI
jgi:hypothetical protein